MTDIKITYLLALFFGVIANLGAAQDPITTQNGKGEKLFLSNCAHCHNGSVPKAPPVKFLQRIHPDILLNTIEEGIMKPMAEHLSHKERQQIVTFLTDENNNSQFSATPLRRCQQGDAWFDYSQPPLISGGGMTNLLNTRSIPKDVAGLPVADIKKLKLKWAFALPDSDTRGRSQPVVAAGGVFLGRGNMLYALDSDSGCAHWVFKAANHVRTALTIDQWTERRELNSDVAPNIYFSDFTATIYAINAVTGQLRWKTQIAPEPGVVPLTSGSLVKHQDRLYVPITAYKSQALDQSCCKHRGGVAALDASTGKVIWKTYTLPEATEQYINEAGIAQFGPSGAGVWSTPTIDEKRGLLYVGTAENASTPAINGGSIVAMNMHDGNIVWVMQASPGEAYNTTCSFFSYAKPSYFKSDMNCPKEYKGRIGLDFAGGSPMLLQDKKGKDIIVAAQKTGWVFGLDPDRNGKVIWRRSVTKGDFNKGNWFGMASNQSTVFVAVNDLYANPLNGPYFGMEELGIYALDGFTGQWLWTAPVSRDCIEKVCRGYGAGLTAIPGAVFAGAQDGFFRALDATTGDLLWQFNTNRQFVTVNGTAVKGGTIGGHGPVIAKGNVYLNSGYFHHKGDDTGNVFLVFSVGGK